jgi:hypothetical protein
MPSKEEQIVSIILSVSKGNVRDNEKEKRERKESKRKKN